jgi:hypothetical protein
MTKAAAIEAVFVDYRRVKGRKTHQIIFEVPSEMWPVAYDVLGEPTIDSSEWFAIAKMNGVAPQPSKGGKLAQRAGILCAEGAFQVFASERSSVAASETGAKEFIYLSCGISSRAHLDHDDEAARKFHDLDQEYKAWRIVS